MKKRPTARDALDGKFVSNDHAKSHPGTTVRVAPKKKRVVRKKRR